MLVHLNMVNSDFLMLLNLDKVDLNEFFNLSIIEDSNFLMDQSIKDEKKFPCNIE